jgi:hypothetical protein
MFDQTTRFQVAFRRAAAIAGLTLLVMAAGINWSHAASAAFVDHSPFETHIFIAVAITICLVVGLLKHRSVTARAKR